MKKTLFLFLFTQIFICCRIEKKNIDTYERLNGNWSFMLSQGYNCYVCPKIEFGENGFGNLILSEKRKVKFKYEILTDNRIKFDFDEKAAQSIFKQSEVFFYENQIKDNLQYIDLLDVKERELIHSLVRELPKNKNSL